MYLNNHGKDGVDQSFHFMTLLKILTKLNRTYLNSNFAPVRKSQLRFGLSR